jgi:hypothetical protein
MTLGTGQTWENLGYRFEEQFLVRDEVHSSDVTRRYNSRCFFIIGEIAVKYRKT